MFFFIFNYYQYKNFDCAIQRKTKVNQINHSDLVTGKIQVNQVKTKLQAGQAKFRQSKPDNPQL